MAIIYDLTKRTGGGGGVNYGDYCTNIRFETSYPSATPNLVFANLTSAQAMFYHDKSTQPYTEITVTFAKQVTSLVSFCECYRASVHGLTKITINGDLSKVTTYSTMVRNHADLLGIYGTPLNFSSVTNENFTRWGHALPSLFHVRYEPNTLKRNHNISTLSALDADSLVSIANGLQSGSYTLTLHDTPKALLSTIMGTVTNNGTYDVFTADASGNTSLLSFITTTKGWTVA